MIILFWIIFRQPLTREIEQPNSEIGLRSALYGVIAIGNEAGVTPGASNGTCVLLANEGCVRALLKQSSHSHQKILDVRILALRGLSAICCVAECIREFEKVRKL